MSDHQQVPFQCPACNAVGWHVDNCPVAAALAAAFEEGRRSVGLGDFLPNPCGEEAVAPDQHFTAFYGTWLACSRRKGHDGEHEHEDSGFTWAAS